MPEALMDRGTGTPARYTECFQWFLAPTDENGANPRPDLAPRTYDVYYGMADFSIGAFRMKL